MAYISEEEINNIKNEANIVDIIGSYITLNKSGNDYVGMCPFHDDHSPSMHVSTKLGIFKCFVCNTGGNVFTFVQKFENVSFPKAIEIVANKCGITFNHTIEKNVSSKFKKEYEIMELSSKFYQNNLASKEGVEAKEYLLKRGIDDSIINEFKIGLSFEDNKLREFFENKKIDLEKAYEIGLLNKVGIDYYDMFISRIMIPLHDMQGNLVGYTARCYKTDEKNKYINSKESIIYKKSSMLFNYYNAKETARNLKQMIIVEGNMDAISLASHGIKNVCALMGVVISKVQIDYLKKLNSKIILMLDNDDAGLKATLSVGDDMYNAGIDLYVVRLSGAKDPDEYIRKFSKDELLNNINHPQKYLDFKIEYLKKNRNLDNIEELTEYVKEVIDSLQGASTIEREVFIGKISKEYNIDAEFLKKSLIPVKEEKKIINNPVSKEKKSKYTLSVENLIYAMLLDKRFYKVYADKLGYLRNKLERDITHQIGEYIEKYKDIDISSFISFIGNNEEMANYISEVIAINHKESIDEKEFCDILSAVIKCIDEEEIKELKIKIKNEQDVAKKIELIEKLTELKKGSGNNEGN
ncbi:MAG: DNA primase [Bacilli bacterium]|nr:DNA primase [Bacilli bacterium]